MTSSQDDRVPGVLRPRHQRYIRSNDEELRGDHDRDQRPVVKTLKIRGDTERMYDLLHCNTFTSLVEVTRATPPLDDIFAKS